ncbi:glycoside hydrolase family 43 protein [Massilia pseudoviolaceinigra]|uniref:glycoside hydrolase family 43 protein n=1 Tax=Massilia pseudoviolaceinigra TaxID=3057165 RepID=UPI002796BAAA|nr:glycoside hydrolase family 43 protein [Massilia sp. CCM 9206]MDQ1923686.1 glycoside hydrolase family 43 protein [Massilia sp. CCM 9206]
MIKYALGALALGFATGVASAANPIVSNIFTADPAALVDKGRVYLYVGHDEAELEGKDYVMKEWRVYSSCDMKTWKDHGSPVQYSTFKWAGRDAWAGDVSKRNGKYYFYSTVDHKTIPGKAIGVAVSDSPTGPFVDARGSALVSNDMTKHTDILWDDIDPGVFVDTDGQAWLYWGNTVLKYAKLKSNMTELDGPIMTHAIDSFTEAPYVYKRGATYYLSYSRYFPEEMVYATSTSPAGPWTFKGVIMDKNENVKTIHQAIIDFNGKSYVFYHNAKLPGGGEFRRSVAVEELHHNADGSIKFVPQTGSGPAANPSPGCQ